MAIKLEGNYAKRLGLPGYSSHQFSVSCETELSDLGQVQGEVARLYGLLQDAVDREIQETGFVPPKDYGAANGQDNGKTPHNRVQTPVGAGGPNGGGSWACSGKQRELILRLVTENNISRDAVENTALDRFGVGVRQLNKLQASGLITELLETTGNTATAGKGGGR